MKNLLIESAIRATLDHFHFATPIEIGDTIGEDKFRVLRILRDMESDGEVIQHSGPFRPPAPRYETEMTLFYLPTPP